MSSHLYNYILHDGSMIKLGDVLDSRGITDENGNTIHFNVDDFPHFHVESNGWSYDIEGLLDTPVVLRIKKITEPSQQQESQTQHQQEKSSTIRSKAKEK